MGVAADLGEGDQLVREAVRAAALRVEADLDRERELESQSCHLVLSSSKKVCGLKLAPSSMVKEVWFAWSKKKKKKVNLDLPS